MNFKKLSQWKALLLYVCGELGRVCLFCWEGCNQGAGTNGEKIGAQRGGDFTTYKKQLMF